MRYEKGIHGQIEDAKLRRFIQPPSWRQLRSFGQAVIDAVVAYAELYNRANNPSDPHYGKFYEHSRSVKNQPPGALLP